MPPRIKICGITRVDDAVAAADLGADAIGLIFYAQSVRHVTLEQAGAVVAALPPFVSVVALFVNPHASEVEHVLAALPIDLLQFHGEESPAFCRAFCRPYLKAVRMRAGVDLALLAKEYHDARGFVTDAFVVGMPGGTGQCFDWTLLPRMSSLPIVLSGGLDEHNVEQAIAQTRPVAVDVCSGVETAKGIKSAAKMAAFIAGVQHGAV